MDWKVVGQLLASSAPLAGKILGGLVPLPGGSLAGEAFGKIIARQFGIPESQATPENTAAAIRASEERITIAKVNAAMEQARAEIAGFAEVEKAWAEAWSAAVIATTAEVNATMRAEHAADVRHPWYTGWRAGSGWTFVGYAIIFGAILMYALAANQGIMERINASWMVLIGFFVLLAAMVGVPIILPPSLLPRAAPPKPPEVNPPAQPPAKPPAARR